MSRGNISLNDIKELSLYIQNANRSIENADRELSRSKSRSRSKIKSFDVINEDISNNSPTDANRFVRKIKTVKTKKKNSVLNVTSPSSNISKATEEGEYVSTIKRNSQIKKKPIKLLFEKFQIPSSAIKTKKSTSRNINNSSSNNTSFNASFNSKLTHHQKFYSTINHFTYKDNNTKENIGFTKKNILKPKVQKKKINFNRLVSYKGINQNDINELFEMFRILNKLSVKNASIIDKKNNKTKIGNKILLIQRKWREHYIKTKMVSQYETVCNSDILVLSKMEFYNYLVNKDKNFKELISTMNKANELYQKCLKSKSFCNMKNVIISNKMFSIVNTHIGMNKKLNNK